MPRSCWSPPLHLGSGFMQNVVSTHMPKLGVKMKRARWAWISPWILLAVIAAFTPPAKAQGTQNAPPSRGQSEAGDQAPQKASGIVPPGVKLLSQMPGAGAPRPFEFPKAAMKTLSNGLRVFVVTDHREPAVAAR